MNPLYVREQIENWVSDFVASDAAAGVVGTAGPHAAAALVAFLSAACERGDCGPDEIEEPHVKAALLEHVARLGVPADARTALPELCAELLIALQDQGRLGGGRALGAYVRALRPAFQQAAEGKARPVSNAGSPLGRNDACPCGSGRKYKKCCLGRMPGA